MKKFRFSLETVLDYKNQVLSSLQNEHGAILAQLHAQEEILENLKIQYYEADDAFTQRKMEGMSILDALSYEQYLRAMERQFYHEAQILDQIKQEEEAKRNQVVAAKQDTSSIEKLKEKKLEAYRKEVQKSEEASLEDFISTTRIMSAAAL